MANDFYAELAERLRAAGWGRVENAKGSHEKWPHPEKTFALLVPRSKSRHTANAILKQAGLPKAF